ncbi:hypothetical protein [Pseudonocardia sp. TRM90224]|uniref:hypothetical protein n=1 Tax=Pseudonocardia sp. TRM90224 TaxID=2812678 RepID=UPI00272E9D9E|nr:hypothetical protein [Pseudonocardia sp. TRM90224]
MEFPSGEEYIRAVQHPELVFTRPELVAARFDVHPLLQIPVPASGTTAVVFKATVGGRAQALRFFTREDASTRERYTALNSWFTERGLTDDVATCGWIDDAILVNGHRWPMVQMEWVDGNTLDQHVEELVEAEARDELRSLAGSWRDLVRRTQSAHFAHGDLQHGNVLVDNSGRLRLVDFDSAWITPFARSAPPNEAGHRNYQPPNRVWGPWMDTFPGLVIYLSLLALSRDPKQWEYLNDGENLLFGKQDYSPPHRTPAWGQVAQLHDPLVDHLAARLRACCTPGWTATGDMESLLGGPAPWWTRTGTHKVQPPAGQAPVQGGPVRTAPRPSPTPRPAPPQSPPPPSKQQTQPTPRPTSRPPAAPPRPAAPPPATAAAGQGNTWWQQTGAPPQAPVPQAPVPQTPIPPAPAPPPPAAARPGSGWRKIGRFLGAAALIIILWYVVFIVMLGALTANGTQPSSAVGTAAVLALVPVLVTLHIIARRKQKKP